MGRRSFKRKEGGRKPRKLILVAVEGQKTEVAYFNHFKKRGSNIKINCFPAKKGSAPLHVLKTLQQKLDYEEMQEGDEAWLVVDRDEWDEKHLEALTKWTTKAEDRYLALSNPKFEFWLLLHFEDCRKCMNSEQCTRALKKHLPGYDKTIEPFTTEQIVKAIDRARKLDTCKENDWPRESARTTVYRLVERLLRHL